MFKNNVDEEADFCEAYKSQILNNDTEEKESPLTSILTILLLLVVIITLSIYGYNYFMNSDSSDTSIPPVSVQTIEDDELKVMLLKDEVVSKEVISKKESTPESTKPKSIDSDINAIADEVKIAIAKNEEENVSSESSKSTYIEDLAKEIDTESTKSTYIKDLEKLTEEIDQERN